jgi:DNA-binding NarL/FixJ family response regulator
MHYPPCLVKALTNALLEGLEVEKPTKSQCISAESFIRNVILNPAEGVNPPLSPKEWLCLELAACGNSAEETAKKLSLSTGTIKNYRERIRAKLDCKTIAHAVYKAFCA